MKLQWAPAGRIRGMLLARRLSSAPGGGSLNLPPELLAVRGFQRGDVLLFNRRGKPLLESFKWSLAEVVAFAGRFASHSWAAVAGVWVMGTAETLLHSGAAPRLHGGMQLVEKKASVS